MRQGDPWLGAVAAPPVPRPVKPRNYGLTMVIDKGLGVRQTADLLELAAEAIDYIKLAFGTSLLYPAPVLCQKIEMIREHGIHVYPGGTLYELAHVEGRTRAFARSARALGFTVLEVSEGTADLTPDDRLRMIDAAMEAGLKVVTEVGKKDSRVRLEAPQVIEQVAADLAQGSHLVIIEGRDSGQGAGAYDDQGRPRLDLVDEVLRGVDRPEVLMWEAPQGKQQLYWIQRLGPGVNLGNVQPHDVVALEATRCALRGDTMRQALRGLTEVFGGGAKESGGMCRRPS